MDTAKLPAMIQTNLIKGEKKPRQLSVTCRETERAFAHYSSFQIEFSTSGGPPGDGGKGAGAADAKRIRERKKAPPPPPPLPPK